MALPFRISMTAVVLWICLFFFLFSLFESIHMHGHVIYISKMLADKLIQAIILIQIIIYTRCFDIFFL